MEDPPTNQPAVDPLDAARDELRRRGIRVTEQRAIVLAQLMGTSSDSTAQALHARLREQHPTLGLATVYRTLGSLAEAGVIDAMQHGHGTCYRHCAPGHHHHLTCTRCHHVVEVRDCAVSEWAARIAADAGFADVTHTLELEGICPACAAPAGHPAADAGS